MTVTPVYIRLWQILKIMGTVAKPDPNRKHREIAERTEEEVGEAERIAVKL